MSLSISPGSPKFISDLFTLDENTSPLHNAVISHDLSHLRQLLSSSSYDVDVLDEYDRSPLIYSIFVGSFGCFELLLQFGANIHILDYESKSPLHWACQLGRVRIAKFILSKDYNINQRDADGRTALHHLAGHHSTKLLSMLLKKAIPANIDQPDSLGMTALHWSAYYNNSEACRLLIRKSSNPANVDNEGRTPVHLCAANDNISCIKMLVDLSGPTLFTLQDSQGCTLLHHVAAIQNVTLLNDLTNLQNNPWLTYINFNAKDHQSRTALHWAYAVGSTSIAGILITRGADFGMMDTNGYFPIHYAVERNFIDCIDSYFSFEYTEDLPDDTNRTCLMLSCQLGYIDSTRTILQRRTDSANYVSPITGMSALHYAASGGSMQCVEILLQYGACVDLQDNLSRTSLSYACENGKSSIVEYLFSSGGSINLPSIDGRLPLHYAVLSNNQSTLAFMISKADTFNIPDQMGRIPLHYACTLDNTVLITMLDFVDINYKDVTGFTPLHWAVMHENIHIIKLLIENGSKYNLMDNSLQRRTPLDLSILNENVSIYNFLRTLGCVTAIEIQTLAVIEIQRFWRKVSRQRSIRNSSANTLSVLNLSGPTIESIVSVGNANLNDNELIYTNSISSKVDLPPNMPFSRTENSLRIARFHKKTEAALVLQLYWRRYLRNKHLGNIYIFEESTKKRKKVFEFMHYRKELAALTIQLAWRQFLRRKLLLSKTNKRKKLYQWSPNCLAIRQRLLIEQLYSQHFQPFLYTPALNSHIYRPSFLKFVPSPAALSFNFAVNQYCRDFDYDYSY